MERPIGYNVGRCGNLQWQREPTLQLTYVQSCMFQKQTIRKEEQTSVEVGTQNCGLFEYMI